MEICSCLLLQIFKEEKYFSSCDDNFTTDFLKCVCKPPQRKLKDIMHKNDVLNRNKWYLCMQNPLVMAIFFTSEWVHHLETKCRLAFVSFWCKPRSHRRCFVVEVLILALRTMPGFSQQSWLQGKSRKHSLALSIQKWMITTSSTTDKITRTGHKHLNNLTYKHHIISCNFHELWSLLIKVEITLPASSGMVHSRHCMQKQVQERPHEVHNKETGKFLTPLLFWISVKDDLSCFKPSLSSEIYNMQPILDELTKTYRNSFSTF